MIARGDGHRSKRRSRALAAAWLALLAVVYAALSPTLAAAVLADRPAALARMLGLPHEATAAAAHDEHAGHAEHAEHAAHSSQPAPSDDDAAHYAHGVYCSLCLNPGSTAALLAPPPAHHLAPITATAAIALPPALSAAAAHPWFRSRAPPHRS